jgi:hypothetical protein
VTEKNVTENFVTKIWSNNMNMISTAFPIEADASIKQDRIVKKLVSVWEKKNSKAARAGGLSLMALSLAACGAEDETLFSQVDIDAATAAGVASVDITTDNAAATAAGVASVDITTDNAAAILAAVVAVDATATTVAQVATNATAAATTTLLTTGSDNVVLDSGNNTLYGVSAATAEAATDTLGAGDVIDGGAGTDTFVLTATATNTGALGESIVSNVEIFNVRQATAGQTSTFNAALINGEEQVNAYLAAGVTTITNLAQGADAGIIGNSSLTNGAVNAGWAATATSGAVDIADGVTAGALTTSGAAFNHKHYQFDRCGKHGRCRRTCCDCNNAEHQCYN